MLLNGGRSGTLEKKYTTREHHSLRMLRKANTTSIKINKRHYHYLTTYQRTWFNGLLELALNICTHLPPFFLPVCLSSTLLACWGTCKEYDCTVCSILCTFVMSFSCMPVYHTPSKMNTCFNLTDLIMEQSWLLFIKSHTDSKKVTWSTCSLTLLSTDVMEDSKHIKKKCSSDYELGNLVTDSKSVSTLRGWIALTQRKWDGPVIPGTWSEGRPRLAWPESIQDHERQVQICDGKTAYFPCASPKGSYCHALLQWTHLPFRNNHETLTSRLHVRLSMLHLN